MTAWRCLFGRAVASISGQPRLARGFDGHDRSQPGDLLVSIDDRVAVPIYWLG